MHLTKRQREIYDYLKDHIRSRGYAPSIVEIGKQFHLSSPATVHKHLTHLEEKGLIRKQQNLSRAIEIIPESGNTLSYHVLGEIAAGKPIEALDQLEVVLEVVRGDHGQLRRRVELLLDLLICVVQLSLRG